MKFESALNRFLDEIAIEYGTDTGIVKLGLEPELFQRVMIDLCHTAGDKYAYFKIVQMGETFIFNVQILPRRRDDF